MKITLFVFINLHLSECRSINEIEKGEPDFYVDVPENILEIEELPDDDQGDGNSEQVQNPVARYPLRRRKPVFMPVYRRPNAPPFYSVPFDSGYGFHSYSQYWTDHPTRFISGIISFFVMFYLMVLMITCCIWTTNNDAIHYQRLQENRAERERLIKNASI